MDNMKTLHIVDKRAEAIKLTRGESRPVKTFVNAGTETMD